MSYTVNPAAMVGPGCFSRLVQRMFSSTPGGIEKEFLEKKFWRSDFLEGRRAGLRRGDAVVHIFFMRGGSIRGLIPVILAGPGLDSVLLGVVDSP